MPPAPPAPATGCELLIYTEANFKGMLAPDDDSQSQIKSGTWDFYSDEDSANEMMGLSAGSYPTLDRSGTNASARSCVPPPPSDERKLAFVLTALFPSPARAGEFAFAAM